MLFLTLLVLVASLCCDAQKLTNTWVLKLSPGTSPVRLGRKLGLEYIRAMPGGVYHAFKLIPRSDGRHISADLVSARLLSEQDKRVEWHQRQVAQQKFTRQLRHNHSEFISRSETYTIHDPLYIQQWHLRGIYNNTKAHVAADVCWNMGSSFRGNAYTMAIVDDGINRRHGDFSINYVPSLSYDFNDDDNDPMASIGDTHGTAAAGVAVAGPNAVCGVGVCPECRVASMRLIAGPSSDYMEASALDYKNAQIGVYSNSWGPQDDGQTMTGPGPVTRITLEHNSKVGRNGLGTIYVWAGGNGAQNGDNSNYDAYVNNRFTIGVGAIGYDGKRAYYSESGACLMVSAPSSGTSGFGITTSYTDRNGAATCTSSFGGTSSAAPLVAGGIALMLGKYPTLTRRDVLGILAKSSVQIDPDSADWTPRNVRGVSHNHQYGWGMLNMPALLTEAAVWSAVQPELSCTTGKVALNHVLADGVGDFNWNSDMPTRVCEGTAGAAINYVEYVELTVWTTQTSRGDLSIILTDPARVSSVLHEPHSDTKPFSPDGWTYGTARHWGQSMRGMWTLNVADKKRNGSRGTIQYVQMTIYGHTE